MALGNLRTLLRVNITTKEHIDSSKINISFYINNLFYIINWNLFLLHVNINK